MEIKIGDRVRVKKLKDLTNIEKVMSDCTYWKDGMCLETKELCTCICSADSEEATGYDRLVKDKENLIQLLKDLRNNSDLWRIPKIGGQDQYAELPTGMRFIDTVLKKLEI